MPIRLIDECRTRRVLELLIILWLLSMADLFFTLWAHFFTPFIELNPIARGLLEPGRIPLLVLGKIGLTAIGAFIFWRLRKFARAEIALWVVVLLYVLLACRWSDYTVEIMALGYVPV